MTFTDDFGCCRKFHVVKMQDTQKSTKMKVKKTKIAENDTTFLFKY